MTIRNSISPRLKGQREEIKVPNLWKLDSKKGNMQEHSYCLWHYIKAGKAQENSTPLPSLWCTAGDSHWLTPSRSQLRDDALCSTIQPSRAQKRVEYKQAIGPGGKGGETEQPAHVIYTRHSQKNNYSEEWKEEVRVKEVQI